MMVGTFDVGCCKGSRYWWPCQIEMISLDGETERISISDHSNHTHDHCKIEFRDDERIIAAKVFANGNVSVVHQFLVLRERDI